MHYCVDASDTVALPEEAEFTLKVLRVKLKLPPLNMYDVFQYCYTFFQTRKNNCCTKIYLQAFRYFHGYYSFENVESIIRRLCNCFFEAFMIRETGILKGKDKKSKQD